MVVIIDPQIAGISGDMLLCALVNIGANKSKIIDGIHIAENFLNGSTINNIDFKQVKKQGTEAIELILDVDEKIHERKATEIRDCIQKSIDKIGVLQKSKEFAISSIANLMNAESKIHGEPPDSVHFHEASSIDTVVDIVGTAIAIEDLNFFEDEIVTTPVAVGSGTITFSHGTTSNPASAILEIFRNSGITISGGRVKQELTTPTGASMLVSLTNSCLEYYPTMKVKSVGYGAGKNDFNEFSNVLKIVHGEKTNELVRDSVQVLETNVDDVSGEILGNLIEKIMANGAKDVTISSAITKKGRPTNLVSVICDSSSMNSILEVLISETGTLGIRVRSSDRYIIPRSIKSIPLTIEGQNFTIRYKIANKQDTKNFKIEFEDLRLVSNSLGKSIRETEEMLRTEIKKKWT